MRRQRTVGTRPEIALRSAVHRLGLRFRTQIRPTPAVRATADVVLTRARIAVFVDGCFWHGCPDHATWPRANAEFWRAKIERNRARDAAATDALQASGWTVIRCWEHERMGVVAGKIRRAWRAALRG
jgi:DNA mismatch endonuclease (patch repair protein)